MFHLVRGSGRHHRVLDQVPLGAEQSVRKKKRKGKDEGHVLRCSPCPGELKDIMQSLTWFSVQRNNL